MRIKCLNYLMKEKTKESKNKELAATWSDTENDFSNEYMGECSHASDSEDYSSDEVPKKMTL